MISVKKLLYGLDMTLNKVATNVGQNIPDEDKIIALNKAQISLIKRKLSVNNVFSLGLDSFKKRYEDLQKLVVPNENISVTKVQDVYTSYSVDVLSLVNKYMFPISIVGMCTKGNCINRPVFAQRIVKHADLDTMMANSNYLPSFEYQDTISLISSDKIYIYTDDTFEINSAYISYIRYPQVINIAGYIELDGTASIDSDCELDNYLEDELLVLAAQELAMNTENLPAIQNSEIKLKNIE